jgi:hypothetical protein
MPTISPVEHNIPLSRHKEFLHQDLHDLNNLGFAHLSCNSRKRDKTLQEWFYEHPEHLVTGINKEYIHL